MKHHVVLELMDVFVFVFVFVFVLSVRCSLLNQPENFQIEVFKHIEHTKAAGSVV